MLHANECACYTDTQKFNGAHLSAPLILPSQKHEREVLESRNNLCIVLSVVSFWVSLQTESIGNEMRYKWQNYEILKNVLIYLSDLFNPCIPSKEFLMKDCRSTVQTEGHDVTRTFFNKWLKVRM